MLNIHRAFVDAQVFNYGTQRRRSTTPPLPLWTPSLIISSLGLWFDANDLGTITLVGSRVSQWNDKSLNARHATQGTGASQPVYNATAMGFLPGISFDGVDDWFLVTSIPTITDNNTYIFSVMRRSSPGIQNMEMGTNTAVSGYGNWWFSDNITYTMLRTAAFGTHGPADTRTGNFINGAIRSNSGTQVFRNGSAVGSLQVPANVGATTFNALGRITSTFNNGPIAEIIFANATITDSVRNQVEGYLAWKWGMQESLPGAHPFRFVAPTA